MHCGDESQYGLEIFTNRFVRCVALSKSAFIHGHMGSRKFGKFGEPLTT